MKTQGKLIDEKIIIEKPKEIGRLFNKSHFGNPVSGNKLELDLPVDLHIIAVEILEDMEFSEDLTLPLKKEYPRILKKVLSLVKKIIK